MYRLPLGCSLATSNKKGTNMWSVILCIVFCATTATAQTFWERINRVPWNDHVAAMPWQVGIRTHDGSGMAGHYHHMSHVDARLTVRRFGIGVGLGSAFNRQDEDYLSYQEPIADPGHPWYGRMVHRTVKKYYRHHRRLGRLEMMYMPVVLLSDQSDEKDRGRMLLPIQLFAGSHLEWTTRRYYGYSDLFPDEELSGGHNFRPFAGLGVPLQMALGSWPVFELLLEAAYFQGIGPVGGAAIGIFFPGRFVR